MADLLKPGTYVLFLHEGTIQHGDIVISKHVISEHGENCVYDIRYFDGDDCYANDVKAVDVSTTVRGLVDRVVLLTQAHIETDIDTYSEDNSLKSVLNRWCNEIGKLRSRLNS